MTLTFDFVNTAGVTSLTISESGPTAPAGFQLGVPQTYFDISTTADFTGFEVEICISYADVSFPDESMLRLFHYDTSTDTWEDRTSSQDLDTDIIFAKTTSLSPFAIFQRTMTFTGFRAPIVSPPAVNRAIAGDTVPLGFGLGGDFGVVRSRQRLPGLPAEGLRDGRPDRAHRGDDVSRQEGRAALRQGERAVRLQLEDQQGLERDVPTADPDVQQRHDRRGVVRLQARTEATEAAQAAEGQLTGGT